jgi:hypothetical protein
MILRGFLGLLGLFHLINGLWMIAAPEAWYAAIPGVAATGPMNHHFIVDIGLAFAASGAGMMMALGTGARAATLALAGAAWPGLHGLFHIWLWVSGGLPRDTHELASTGIGVIVISLLGFALAWTRARQEGVV